MLNKNGISRRGFLKTSGAVAGAVIAGTAIAASSANAASMDSSQDLSKWNSAPRQKQFRARMFFTDVTDFQILAQAAERIFPKDKTGPGAIDLGVPYFIDNQLASAYGLNAREYVQGPYHKGTAQQTYQTPMLRREIFMVGIAAIKKASQDKYQKDFLDLSDSQKDEILKSMEKGLVAIEGISSSYFFSLLKGVTLAGVYADPIYNGNDNMDGWRMKKYPGAQMSYSSIMMKEDFQVIAPMSLSDME